MFDRYADFEKSYETYNKVFPLKEKHVPLRDTLEEFIEQNPTG